MHRSVAMQDRATDLRGKLVECGAQLIALRRQIAAVRLAGDDPSDLQKAARLIMRLIRILSADLDGDAGSSDMRRRRRG
jgi:hypothetical protein